MIEKQVTNLSATYAFLTISNKTPIDVSLLWDVPTNRFDASESYVNGPPDKPVQHRSQYVLNDKYEWFAFAERVPGQQKLSGTWNVDFSSREVARTPPVILDAIGLCILRSAFVPFHQGSGKE